MGDLLKIIVEWLWKNYLETIFKKLDRWDVLFLVVLSAICYFGFDGAPYLNFDEKLLWGSTPIVVSLFWFSFRKLRSKSFMKLGRVEVPSLLVEIGIFLVLTGTWVLAEYRVYRIPSFGDGVTGLYVARLGDDHSDASQETIVTDLMSKLAENVKLKDVKVEVKRRPRRIRSDDQARAIGKAGGAALVLWGKRPNPEPELYLSFIENKGIFPARDRLRGFSAQTNPVKLPTELATFEEVLALFFEGYSFYYSQSPDYAEASSSFDRARALLENVVGKTEGLTTAKRTLGTIHFFLGNSLLHYGNRMGAIRQYEKAIDTTSLPGYKKAPQYVEPLNNLGMLLVQEKNAAAAITHLEEAERLCASDPGNATCPAVSYNLGSAYALRREYEHARRYFEQAIERFMKNTKGHPEHESELQFLEAAQQFKAFAYVKVADQSDKGESLKYEEAEVKLNQAMKDLASVTGKPAPVSFNITRARIHLGRKEWPAAIALLESTISELSEGGDRARAYSILATAYGGQGEPRKTVDCLNELFKYSIEERQDGLDSLGRIASEKLNEALEKLEAGEHAPGFVNITRARIQIGRKQWQTAIDLLEATIGELREPGDRDWVYSLLAAAYTCLDKTGKTAEFLDRISPAEQNRALAEFRRLTADCN